jgi:hypothetical protein
MPTGFVQVFKHLNALLRIAWNPQPCERRRMAGVVGRLAPD